MINPLEALESRLADGAGVFVNPGVDPADYFNEIAEDIRRNQCLPFLVSAVVMAPGIPGFEPGEKVAGVCVARAKGRWLVYREQDDLFLAFWGGSAEDLGAHGIFGSPLYCWSA